MNLVQRLRRKIEWRLQAITRRKLASRRTDAAPRALLVANYDPHGLQTIVDYIATMVSGSRLRIDVLNLRYCPHDASGPMLPRDVRLADYQCVIVNPTVSYDPDRLLALEAGGMPLRDCAGVKVMLKQDEHYRTARLLEYLEKARFDIVATCLEAGEARRVYPSARLALVPVLPGYVPPDMLGFRYPPLDARPIDVGYRGSPQPWNFGRLAYEKWQIAERFVADESGRGPRTDISSRWEDRFFGQAWFDFLGSCKATLGVESGTSIFDFTGAVCMNRARSVGSQILLPLIEMSVSPVFPPALSNTLPGSTSATFNSSRATPSSRRLPCPPRPPRPPRMIRFSRDSR